MRAAQRYRGIVHTCKVMLAEEGWRAFYAGIGVNLVRAVPAAMTTMLTYEYLQRGIQDMQAEGEARLKPKEAYSV
jgi:solute carrier family 25 (mitochondrial folate transporter), member 32